MNQIYHISRGYRKATIWMALEHRRCAIVTIRPDADQKTRRARYEAIAEGLKDEGITAPPYEEKDARPNTKL